MGMSSRRGQEERTGRKGQHHLGDTDLLLTRRAQQPNARTLANSVISDMTMRGSVNPLPL